MKNLVANISAVFLFFLFSDGPILAEPLSDKDFRNFSNIFPDIGQQIVYMQSICTKPVQSKQFGKQQVAVCGVCPRSSDSAPLVEGDTFFRTVVVGSFTGQDKVEAMLSVDSSNCESHANNWGGAFLLRKTSSRWRQTIYQAGRNCDKYWVSPTLRSTNAVFCLRRMTFQGYTAETLSVQTPVDFGINEKIFLSLGNNLGIGNSCPLDEDFYESMGIDNLTFSKTKKAHFQNIKVDVVDRKYSLVRTRDGSCTGPGREMSERFFQIKYRLVKNEIILNQENLKVVKTLQGRAKYFY